MEAVQRRTRQEEMRQVKDCEASGLACPSCQSLNTRVIDSRANKPGSLVRRRRVCPVCETRFSTYETLASAANVRAQIERVDTVIRHLREAITAYEEAVDAHEVERRRYVKA